MSDVYHFWTKGKIPSVYFGPGLVEMAHVSDEFIDVVDIHQATEIYLDLTLRILAPDVDRQAARKKIDSERAVKLTQELVRFASENPPGDQREIVEFLKRWLSERDIQFEEHARYEHLPCLVGKIGDPSSGPTLHFNGHTDVVPAGDGWTRDPYGAEIENGRMYGRGTCDMKGGIAAFLTVAEFIKQENIPLQGCFELSLVPDEETGGDDGAGFLVEEGIIKPDFAIVAEPSSMRMSITESALLWLTFETKGDRVHTLASPTAVNAVEDMAEVIQAIKQLRSKLSHLHHPKLGGLLLTVNMVDGGIKTNVVPDKCEIQVDCRFPASLGITIDDMLATFDEMLDELRDKNPSLQVSYTYHGKNPFRQSPDTPIIHYIKETMLEVTGKPAVWWRTDVEPEEDDQ